MSEELACSELGGDGGGVAPAPLPLKLHRVLGRGPQPGQLVLRHCGVKGDFLSRQEIQGVICVLFFFCLFVFLLWGVYFSQHPRPRWHLNLLALCKVGEFVASHGGGGGLP